MIGKLLGTHGPKIGGIIGIIAGALKSIGLFLSGEPLTSEDWAVLTAVVGLIVNSFGSRPMLMTSAASGALGPVVQYQAPAIDAATIAVAEAKSDKTVARELASVPKP